MSRNTEFSVREQIVSFVQRKGRIHLSGIIGGLYWRNGAELVEETIKLIEDDVLDAEFIAKDEGQPGHWYIMPNQDMEDTDNTKKLYSGFLYPTKGKATMDVIDIMSRVRLKFDPPSPSELRNVDKYLRAEIRKVTRKGSVVKSCDMAFDYRGRLYFTDWVNPALQKEVRNNFTFKDGSKIHWIDATSSGIQMLSILSRCEESAKACNLINTGMRRNAYAEVADRWGKTKDMVKKPVMTSFYGSKKVPEETFGDEVDEFYDILSETMPGAWAVNEEFLALHKECNADTLQWEWEMPDGFKVDASVFVTEYQEATAEMFGHICEMTIGFRVNKPRKSNKFLSANLAHSMDSYVLREVIRLASKTSLGCDSEDEALFRAFINDDKPFEIVPIHDCFGVREENIKDVQDIYAYVLSKLVDSSFPEYVKQHFNVDWDSGTLTGEDIMKSQFALVEE